MSASNAWIDTADWSPAWRQFSGENLARAVDVAVSRALLRYLPAPARWDEVVRQIPSLYWPDPQMLPRLRFLHAEVDLTPLVSVDILREFDASRTSVARMVEMYVPERLLATSPGAREDLIPTDMRRAMAEDGTLISFHEFAPDYGADFPLRAIRLPAYDRWLAPVARTLRFWQPTSVESQLARSGQDPATLQANDGEVSRSHWGQQVAPEARTALSQASAQSGWRESSQPPQPPQSSRMPGALEGGAFGIPGPVSSGAPGLAAFATVGRRGASLSMRLREQRAPFSVDLEGRRAEQAAQDATRQAAATHWGAVSATLRERLTGEEARVAETLDQLVDLRTRVDPQYELSASSTPLAVKRVQAERWCYDVLAKLQELSVRGASGALTFEEQLLLDGMTKFIDHVAEGLRQLAERRHDLALWQEALQLCCAALPPGHTAAPGPAPAQEVWETRQTRVGSEGAGVMAIPVTCVRCGVALTAAGALPDGSPRWEIALVDASPPLPLASPTLAPLSGEADARTDDTGATRGVSLAESERHGSDENPRGPSTSQWIN